MQEHDTGAMLVPQHALMHTPFQLTGQEELTVRLCARLSGTLANYTFTFAIRRAQLADTLYLTPVSRTYIPEETGSQVGTDLQGCLETFREV